MRAFIVTPGFEPALEAELTTPACRPRRPSPPGVVICDETAAEKATSTSTSTGTSTGDERPDLPPDLVFARQTLPDATEITGASAQRLAEAAYAALEGRIDAAAAAGPFTLHPFAWPPEPALGSRVELVGRQLLALLKERRRRAFRGYRPSASSEIGNSEIGDSNIGDSNIGNSFEPGALLVQLLALDRERLIVSAAHPRSLPRGGTDISPWPAGSAPVAIDRAPPSRAYQKLEEAFRWLDAAPTTDQTCVDLGGSPGGWAYTALKRGARVTAVDRAPLERPAAGHAKLTGIIGNAFTFEPPRAVDWLLCDVVCEPARSLALIERWLDQRWCRHLVVTVKFKGRDGYGVLADVPALFARAGWRFARVKQLLHNKNEVTVLARKR